MAKKIIPVKEISSKHPHALRCTTDSAYANFATTLYGSTAKYQADLHMTDREMVQLITRLTLYFEDIVADCGIWAGFTGEMQKRYGRTLPFYTVDAAGYDASEPHAEDIRFLIWLTLTSQHPERISNPEMPFITAMAEDAYRLMDENLETVPINDDLKEFLSLAPFAKDFYEMRDVIKWFLFDCYLSSHTAKNLSICSQIAQNWARNMRIDIQQAFYLAECTVPFRLKTGPMALTPQEWLGLTLRANGQDAIAEKVEKLQALDFSAFLILKAERGEGFQLMSVDNVVFDVTDENIGNPNPSDYDSKVVVGAFVNYGDEWFLNGHSYWSEHKELFDNIKREHDGHIHIEDKHVTEYLKSEDGQRLFFFEDYHAYAGFLTGKLHLTQQNVDRLQIDIEAKNIAVFIGTKGELMTMPNGARCIQAENNPFYDKAVAQKDALTIALTCPPDFSSYLVENHLLPDAALNSHLGREQGEAVVQDNFDFLVKTFRPQDF